MADARSKKAKLLAQRKKLDAEIKAIEAKERAQKRKDDTRRKIILGGLVMKAAAGEPQIMSWLKSLAGGESVSQKDRELLDLWFAEQEGEMPPRDAVGQGGASEASGDPDRRRCGEPQARGHDPF